MAGEYAGSRGVVIVDTTGTAVGLASGVERGSGSRVEPIGTATHTAVGTGYQAVVTSSTIPAWAKSVHASCVVTAITGSPANMYGALVLMADGTNETLSSGGAPLNMSGTIVTPIVGATVQYSVNPDLPLVTGGLLVVISYGNIPILPSGKVKLYLRTETAPATWSVACTIYARG